MKYTWEEAFHKRKFGVPIWACNYELPIVHFAEDMTRRPMQGEILKRSECYEDVMFVPYDKQGKLQHRKNATWLPIGILHFADTQEECEELWNEILEEKAQWCRDMLETLSSMRYPRRNAGAMSASTANSSESPR